MMSRREPGSNQQINQDGTTLLNEVREAYNGTFMVDLYVCAWTRNFLVAHRLDALNDSFTLPLYLIDMHQDGA